MLNVQLFGKLHVQSGGRPMGGLDARRVQELLVYLLLNRDRPHAREHLADLMWGDRTSTRVLKGLRQTLWKLRTVLGAQDDSVCRLLKVDTKYVQLNTDAGFWLDVAEFESAWKQALGTPGAELDGATTTALRAAVRLYRGDLLDGWYQDWCLVERERLRNIYLDMLGKLMSGAEANAEYESGLEYGTMILQLDPARERTHRIMMRLHYLSGRRVGAIRQYEQCVATLREHIGVDPSRRTVALYDQIRGDELDPSPVRPRAFPVLGQAGQTVSLSDVLAQLQATRQTLSEVQQCVEQQIVLVERALSQPRRTDATQYADRAD